MSTFKKTVLLGTTSVLAVRHGAGVAVAAVPGDDAPAAPAAAEAQNAAYHKTDIVTVEAVPGLFEFTQNEVSSNDVIASIAKAAQFMCNSQGHLVKDDSTLADNWEIAFTGQGEHAQGLHHGRNVAIRCGQEDDHGLHLRGQSR